MINLIKKLFGGNKVHNAVMAVLKRKIELAEIELQAELKSADKRKKDKKASLVRDFDIFLQDQIKKDKEIKEAHKAEKAEATEKVVNRLLAKIV